MASNPPTLHMLCGKIASGKSTLARRLADADSTVLLVEDAWLKPLFGDELKTLEDYTRCTRKLRAAMAPHVSALLNANVSVVLDFAANTPGQRAWMRGLLDASGAAHLMHVLNVSDAKRRVVDRVCLDGRHRSENSYVKCGLTCRRDTSLVAPAGRRAKRIGTSLPFLHDNC